MNYSEEEVTKGIINWLVSNGWAIVCYDFPQSGTGIQMHPNNANSKTEGIVIPDIVAIKNSIVLDFENKDHYMQSDFDKVQYLKNTSDYNDAWEHLLRNHQYSDIYYGIGLPFSDKNAQKVQEHIDQVDFAVLLNSDGSLTTFGAKADLLQ